MKKKDIIKRALRYIRGYRWAAMASILMAAFTVALTLYVPVLTGRAIDKALDCGNVDFAGIVKLLARIGVVVAITGAGQWLMNTVNNRIVFHTVWDIRRDAFNKLHRLPLSYLDQKGAGLLSRMISDADQFADGLLMGFAQLFTGVATILGTLLFMLSVNVRITLAVVVITPLSLFAAGFITKKTYRFFSEQSKIRAEQTALVDEVITGQKTVKAFSRENAVTDKFDEVNGRLVGCGVKATFFSSLTNPVTRFVNSLVYAAVGVLGAYTAATGDITVGMLTCFLSYAGQYTRPFNEISGVIAELQNALACAARVFELLDEPEQSPEAPARLTDVQGFVEAKNVSFGYEAGNALIENFNLSVRPGMHVAIVGPTGCGKTTFINLLMRFYDVNGGSILVDRTDVRDVSRESLRKSYGMVLQDVWLTGDTVRSNVAFGRPDATLEEIVRVCRACHCHSFIMRLKDGYDTVLGEDGGGLSQGQKQLLCIARVMLCLPPMLILDEATSSIDTRTEMLIQQAFLSMMQGRTAFIVAHRLSTVRNADLIVVMRDGHIVEQGSHEALLKNKGFYEHLFMSQFER